jgi:hypothetical protein
MKKHELKTWPKYFKAVQKGEKTFELRKNDRDFKKGDILILREFVPCKICGGCGRAIFDVPDFDNCCEKPHGKYTGKVIGVEITYIMDDGFGLRKEYVAMAIHKSTK